MKIAKRCPTPASGKVTFFRGFYLSLGLLALILVASCSNVTETGNPCPAGSCPQATPNIGEGAPYVNDGYGATVTSPPGWTYEEVSDSSVDFESPAPNVSTARMTFEKLDPKPESLFAYLSDTYPDRTFVRYSTMHLAGYMFDNPEAGENSGDLREYFFFNNDVLVRVEVEVFGARLVEIGSLLNGILFN